jgi:hypothetical protein
MLRDFLFSVKDTIWVFYKSLHLLAALDESRLRASVFYGDFSSSNSSHCGLMSSVV